MLLVYVLTGMVTIICGCKAMDEDNITLTNDMIIALRSEYCPYTNLCHSKASKIISDQSLIPCCNDCSCASDCMEKRNCCPDNFVGTTADLDDKNESSKKKPSAACLGIIVQKPRGITGSNDITRYFVVDRCPLTEINMTLINKCTGPLQTSYEEVIWVTSATTKKIYKNRFCASCNDVFEFTEWGLQTDCSRILNGDYDFKNGLSFPRNCYLWLSPPIDEDVSTNMCVLPDVSKCNETGRWQSYNKTIEEACLAFELHFYEDYPFFNSNMVYRNVFCYVCNKSPEMSIIHSCQSSVKNSLRDMSEGMSFTGLLDPRFFKKKENAHHKCAIYEVEDEFLNKCRHLTCPVLTAPFYGTCKRLVEEVFNLGMSVLFRLTPDWEKSTITMNDVRNLDLEELGKLLAKDVQRETGLGDCKRCVVSIRLSEEPYLFRQQSSNYFIKQIIYTTDERCGADFMASQLLRLHGKESSVSVEGVKITFVMRRIKDTAERILHTSREFFGKHDRNCLATQIIDLKNALLCPTITLTNEEYLDIMNNTESTPRRRQINALFGIKRGESVISNDVARKTSVCVDEYRLALTEIRVNNAVNPMCFYLLILSAFIVGALTNETVH